MCDKKTLRTYIREQKRRLSQQELGEMSLLIQRSLVEHEKVKEAQTVMAYHALPDEVGMNAVIEDLYAKGKTVLLPLVVSDTEMIVCKYEGPESIQKGHFGIMEPVGNHYDDITSIDIALVPGVAFDACGHRLGRGKGYYDRFLSHARNIYKVGICYPFQLVDAVPYDENDVEMDEVVCG